MQPLGTLPSSCRVPFIKRAKHSSEEIQVSSQDDARSLYAFPAIFTTQLPPTPSREVISTQVATETHFPHLPCDRMGTEHTDDLSESVVCLFLLLILPNFSTFTYTSDSLKNSCFY